MMAAKPNPTKYYPITIPALCFARHHPAEGVKHFALEAWRDVVETNGRALLAMYAKETSEFYVSQTKQDNDSLREGACWSIGELAAKVALNVRIALITVQSAANNTPLVCCSICP